MDFNFLGKQTGWRGEQMKVCTFDVFLNNLQPHKHECLIPPISKKVTSLPLETNGCVFWFD